ncbi:hypothetical protein I8748_27755 [Nostoc sp. CENA67]|uniref:Uncharacterized protein n=1 Tax=Amazonocrinis nigriterrae CENA67 TaxID=2794033 RepID=A0A8J7HU03_9NOST|nr:hypothetical protein [Amazonocrinis nigriterrae]MBH8565918.1 hypothetical protein [Amazonocrinis nigriterrae CENA67]
MLVTEIQKSIVASVRSLINPLRAYAVSALLTIQKNYIMLNMGMMRLV